MKRLHDPRWAYALVNLSTLLWASNITLGRALRSDIGAVTLAAARFSVAGLLFFVLFRGLFRRRADSPSESRPGRDWPWLVGMGITGVFGFPILIYLALQRTTASHVALINGTAPLMTVFLAALFLHERISRATILGAVVSLVGVALIITAGESSGLSLRSVNSGDLIAFANAGLWGLYSVISRVATRYRSSLSATAFSTWFALPLLFPAAAIEWRVSPPSLTLPVLLAALYIGIFPSVIGFMAWNEGVRRVGPGQAMAFYNMLPVYGVFLGVAFLGESLTPLHWLGGLLVIAGGLFAAYRRKPVPARQFTSS